MRKGTKGFNSNDLKAILQEIEKFEAINKVIKGENTMLKIKLEFEFDQEQLEDLFESYDIKFTKKKVSELKRDIKEHGIENDIESEVVDDVERILGDLITERFDK